MVAYSFRVLYMCVTQAKAPYLSAGQPVVPCLNDVVSPLFFSTEAVEPAHILHGKTQVMVAKDKTEMTDPEAIG